MSNEDVDRLKVHRRELMLDGERFTVLSPRPQTEVRFSTNRHNETWHIACGVESARFLARVMWAMAYQHGSPTIVVVDDPFLVRNPFDAGPSDPIAVVNTELASPSVGGFGALRSQLPLESTSSAGTVRLQTRGLDLARADPASYEDSVGDATPRWNARRPDRWLQHVDGVVALAAPAQVLRDWALALSIRPSQDGEIQVLENFAGRVETAIAGDGAD